MGRIRVIRLSIVFLLTWLLLFAPSQKIPEVHAAGELTRTTDGELWNDDFSGDLSAYTQAPAAQWSIAAGELIPDSPADDEQIFSTSNMSQANVVIEAKVKFAAEVVGDNGIMGRVADNNNTYLWQVRANGDDFFMYKQVADGWTQLDTGAVNIDANTWYVLKFSI
jgi:hypothetical protein